MSETKNEPVQMYYPPDAGGPQSMVLTGAGYFEKGKLTTVASREMAEGIVKRGKGPRIATPEDLAAANPPTTAPDAAPEPGGDEKNDDDQRALAGVGRRLKRGEQVITG